MISLSLIDSIIPIIIMLCVSLLLLITLVFLFMVYNGRLYVYWYFQNVPYVPLKFPYIYGNVSEGRHVALQYADIYENNRLENHPLIGIYTMFFKPSALIVDSKLIRQVLSENFHHFEDRGMFYNEKDDPPSAILGTLGNFLIVFLFLAFN